MCIYLKRIQLNLKHFQCLTFHRIAICINCIWFEKIYRKMMLCSFASYVTDILCRLLTCGWYPLQDTYMWLISFAVYLHVIDILCSVFTCDWYPLKCTYMWLISFAVYFCSVLTCDSYPLQFTYMWLISFAVNSYVSLLIVSMYIRKKAISIRCIFIQSFLWKIHIIRII